MDLILTTRFYANNQAYQLGMIPDDRKFSNKLGTEGMVSYLDNFTICTIAGTNDAKDCLINLFSKDGFEVAYWAIRDQMLEKINAGRSENLILCGHSLGGAIALHAALDLNKKYNVKLVTFGQPKTLPKQKKDPTKDLKKYIRVVNRWDVITEVPFSLHHYGERRLENSSNWNPHSYRKR